MHGEDLAVGPAWWSGGFALGAPESACRARTSLPRRGIGWAVPTDTAVKAAPPPCAKRRRSLGPRSPEPASPLTPRGLLFPGALVVSSSHSEDVNCTDLT